MLNKRTSKRSSLGPIGLMTILLIGALLVPMGQGKAEDTVQTGLDSTVPALPPGVAKLFELDKDAVLSLFGTPENIFYGDEKYTLDNLPETYYLCFEDLSFCIHEDAVVGINLLNPRFVFGNGIRPGDSEDKVKAAFGPDYTIREFAIKDYLDYEHLDLRFEIYKPQRKALEINIGRDYGNVALLQAHAQSPEFNRLLPERIANLNIDTADLARVKQVFGEPVQYIWGPKTLNPDNLPYRYIAVYPSGFHILMLNGHIVELRHEGDASGYVFEGKLRVGDTLDKALDVLGPPEKIVQGEDNGFADKVLYKDIDGHKGHDYYRRSDHNVRLWFANHKITAIYMTRSDYSDGPGMGPVDPEFNRLLPEKIAKLNIDTADLNQTLALFGEPLKYLWGNETFTHDALPSNFILAYPCDFAVWIQDNRIKEIRHGRGSKYVYRNALQVGSTLDEALAVLGQPDEVVQGQENTFNDKVLYKDIKGRKGHCYYHRSDQNVRVWFGSNKVIAIYMTRSDFPTK